METNEKGKKVWLCKCKCGNEKYILLHSLSSKRIRDCGCGSYKLNQYNKQFIYICTEAKNLFLYYINDYL